MRRQSGNLLTIIAVIVAVVAVAGALGYVAWSKFGPGAKVATTQETQKSEDSKVDEQKKVTLSSYCLTYEKLCFDYPATWTLQDDSSATNAMNEFLSGDHVSLTDSSSGLVLKFETAISGIGGICESDTASTRVLQGTEIAGLNGYDIDYDGELSQAYVARVVTHDTAADGFTPEIYVSKTKQYVSEGTVTGFSGLCFSNFIDGRHATFSDDTTAYGAVSIGSSFDVNGTVTNKGYQTLDEAVAQFDTVAYQEAATILESLHYQ